MIKLDIQSVIFYYVCIALVGLMMLWIFSRPRGGRLRFGRGEEAYIWKCGICLHDYIDSSGEDISTCPVCGSYNKKGVAK